MATAEALAGVALRPRWAGGGGHFAEVPLRAQHCGGAF